MGGAECPSRARIENKWVVVTGANGGIGFETAKELAKRGLHKSCSLNKMHDVSLI
jgi:NAD(P)-dependent dehydrogenase (short-subunit alcohol dehydrogenase family)